MNTPRWWAIALALLGLCAAAGMASLAHAQVTFTTLLQFDYTDGAFPNSGPQIQGLDGNFYGTTQAGGANNHGTIFKITSGGALTTLYSFCPQKSCGVDPSGLVFGTDDNFYGTAELGGAACSTGSGCGMVFRFTQTDKFSVMHDFGGSDGAKPGPDG